MTEPCIPPMRIYVECVSIHGRMRTFYTFREKGRWPNYGREVFIKPAPHDPRTEGLRDHTPA